MLFPNFQVLKVPSGSPCWMCLWVTLNHDNHTKPWQCNVPLFFLHSGSLFQFQFMRSLLVFEETQLREPILPCSCSPIRENLFFSCSYHKWLIILQVLGFTYSVLPSFIRVLCLLTGLLWMYSRCLPTSWPLKPSSNTGLIYFFWCSVLIKRKSTKILGVHTMVIS